MDAVKLQSLLVQEISAVNIPAHGPQGSEDFDPSSRDLEGWMVAKAAGATEPSTSQWFKLLEDLSEMYADSGWFRNLRSLVQRLSDEGLVQLPAAEMEEIRRDAYASFLPDLEATQKAQGCRGALGAMLRSEDPRVRKAARDSVVEGTLTEVERAAFGNDPAGPTRPTPSARPAVIPAPLFRRVANGQPRLIGGQFFR